MADIEQYYWTDGTEGVEHGPTTYSDANQEAKDKGGRVIVYEYVFDDSYTVDDYTEPGNTTDPNHKLYVSPDQRIGG